MYDFVWKLLGWPTALLSGGIAGFDATFWISDGYVSDRIVGGGVCGFLIAALWLIFSAATRSYAER